MLVRVPTSYFNGRRLWMEGNESDDSESLYAAAKRFEEWYRKWIDDELGIGGEAI